MRAYICTIDLFRLNLIKLKITIMKYQFLVPFLISFFIYSSGNAQTFDSSDLLVFVDEDSILNYEMPSIRVLGKNPRLMDDVPGSAAYMNNKAIQSIQSISGNEVLRSIVGIHVTDEEGLGLRANIGIRGLDPSRSSKVLILEDGIPVALNPYGEPQMYYTPTMDRMVGVEVLKGSGQVLFGPQTIGGVINYITADPPKEQKGKINLKVGQGGFVSSLLSYGNTFGNAGVQISYLRKKADDVSGTSFLLNDFTAKLKLDLNKKSKLGFKLGIYDENSNSTYVGLTQAMYDSKEYDYTMLAPDDNLAVRRMSSSLTHEYRPNLKWKIKTTAFGYTTNRNWQRQDFTYTPIIGTDQTVWGDVNDEGGAIFMKDSNGHRNRQFEVAGIEPKIIGRFSLGKIENKMTAGLRFLFERGFEQRVNGTKKDAASGDLRNDEIRTGKAFSTYVNNQFTISPKWSITAGARFENYHFERNILRSNYQDTSLVSSSSVQQIIPGIGFNYNWKERFTFFGGIHRGFAPPSVKSAISNSGEVYNLNAELSWNSELGIRGRLGEEFDFEFTGFRMDFSNQIIPVSEASGGIGSGLVNGGSTLHQGVEVGFNWGLGNYFLPKKYQLVLSGNATYVQSVFNKERFVDEVNIENNETPYSPDCIISSTINFRTSSGFQFQLIGNYTGTQFTDELNTITPSANGRIGQLQSYFIIDATTSYEIKKWKTTIQLSAKNLTNERYISTRRPQGIRVGLPFYISGGIEKRF